jgi:superoxide dismutase, Fe-Mn family
MLFTAKDYRHLMGLRGFSETLFEQHFSLYEGYVKNASELLERITSLRTEAKPPTLEVSELSRRLAWEFNGMRLHELYFDGLTHEPPPLDMSSSLVEGLAHSFSSLEAWRQDFRAVGAMRGIGWVVMCVDRVSGRLLNTWINEHDTGCLVTATPILVMDVFEHAYITDYGLKKESYIEAFMRAVDWHVVEARLHATAERMPSGRS